MPKTIKIEDTKSGKLPLRTTYRQPKGVKSGRLLIKCGCCDERLEVHPDAFVLPPDADPHRTFIEINGVDGSVDQWRQIFGPLLGMRPANDAE